MANNTTTTTIFNTNSFSAFSGGNTSGNYNSILDTKISTASYD